jgi:hypothetical protein
MTKTERQQPATPEAERRSALEEIREQLERSGERLQEGRMLSIPGDGEVPARSLGALGIFVVVFVAAYLLSWAALGTAGLVIGFFAGLIAGALAVKLFADRARAGT